VAVRRTALPVGSRAPRPLVGAAVLAAFGLVVFFAMGMHRGLLLSSDIKSTRLPWAPLYPARSIQSPSLSDAVWQFVPWLSFARRELRAGRIPLWNPHQDGGVPLLGNSSSALLSPLVWPTLLLGTHPGWNLSLLCRVLLAAGSAFLFLRSIGRSRLAAALGGVAYALSGPFVAWLEHPQALCAAPAPLLLLFIRKTTLLPSARNVLGVALSTFLVLAGGHPETELMVALLATGVLIVGPGGWNARTKAAGGALMGAGLAAPALLPFLDYFRVSAARAGEGRSPFVLPLSDLLRFLTSPVAGSNVIEAAAGVSVVVLLLVPVGLTAWRTSPEIRFWGLAAFAMLLFIYANPISRFVAAATPVYWTRWLLFLPLALAVIGSTGLDVLRSMLERRGNTHSAAALALLAVAVAAGELLWRAVGVHGVTPPARVAETTPLIKTLRRLPGPFRVLPLHTVLSPNSATDYGLDDVRGYDALGPAGWRKRRARIGIFRDLPTQKDAIEPWDLEAGGAALDEWNVTCLVAPPQFAFGPAVWRSRKGLDLEEIYAGPDGRIFRNRRAKPRIRLEGPGSISIVERVPGRWLIEAQVEGRQRLVVADPFFPGWIARVDGVRVPFDLRAGDPMALPLSPGIHRVELAYRPLSFRIGLLLFTFSAVGLAALAFSWFQGCRIQEARSKGIPLISGD
jgi:hypothetical protein